MGEPRVPFKGRMGRAADYPSSAAFIENTCMTVSSCFGMLALDTHLATVVLLQRRNLYTLRQQSRLWHPLAGEFLYRFRAGRRMPFCRNLYNA